MRNRVALKAARTAAMTSKLVLVMVLVPVALVAVAQGASAATALADSEVAAESAAFGFLGPVGIGAVVLGFGGLVAGLLRHRRRVTAAATVGPAADAAQPVEPAESERVG